MNTKRIQLHQLAEIGSGMAEITDTSVNIEVKGINGAMKAWLIGGEAVPIGNLVDGKLQKNIDTTKNIGVLITQSGKQMLIGNYADGKQKEKTSDNELTEKTALPFESYGFEWKKVMGKRFETNNLLLKYILSNKAVYESYKAHKHYYIGSGRNGSAIALPCSEIEDNPLKFLGRMSKRVGEYVIVCIDEETGKLYIPE